MSSKKLQILGTFNNSDSDTVDGKHASDFASASDVEGLQSLIGETPVSEQISSAINNLSLSDNYAGKTHYHTKDNISDFEHTHGIAEITNLQTVLDDKQPIGDYATKSDAQGYADAKDSAIAEAKNTGSNAQTHSEGVAKDLDEEVTRAKGVENNLTTRVASNEVAITKLNANVDTVGSVDYRIAQAVAAVMENPDETMNSINELVTWANDHADDALELSNTVSGHTAAIDALEDKIGDTSVSSQISSAIANKVDTKTLDDHILDFEAHVDNSTHITSSERTKWNSAEKNQNAFSNVVVGSTTVSADTATDTLTLVAGSNVTITPDATNDKITIAAKDTVYTHPNSGVTAGTYKSVIVNAAGHVTGGSNPTTLSGYGITDAATKTELGNLSGLVGDTAVSTQISDAVDNCITELSVSGKTVTYTKGDGSTGTITTQDTNTTYSAATTSAAGLMSAADKTKLNGIATGANAYSHPTSSGNKHIPSGGSSGQILRWSDDGTAAWGSDNNTTYSAATQSAQGLMSAADKTKLDGIATGANKITVDSALSTTSTNPVQNKVVNTAISNLNTLVGDTAVSTQVTNGTKSFIKGLSVSGKTITYTKGDGTTGTITTQDTNTTYAAATSSALGLVKSGTDITVDSNGNVSVNNNSHTHTASNISDAIPASKGGTGQTTLANSAKVLINALSEGDATKAPLDADFYISQYIGGGTSNTNYYRRPMSTLWSYIKGKSDSVYATKTSVNNLADLVGDTPVASQIESSVSALENSILGGTW